MRAKLLPWVVTGGLVLACGGALGQSRVYSCVDAKGHRLTSDRLIPECSDREQIVMDPRGVRTTIPPSLTAREREVKEEQDRKLAEEKMRADEDRRANRALLTRYPSQAAHDAERSKALKSVQDVTLTAQRHIEVLQSQRKRLKDETEFYKDPAKYPLKLKRQLEEVDQQLAAQQRFVAGQDEEKKRVNAKFDEELGKLRSLWAAAAGVAAASAPVKR